ncbi:MAG: AMP-binding protein, partial [Chromatiales bacterium]
MSDNALSDSRGRQHFHSYANLCRQIDATLQALLDQDVKPGTRIILPFETRIGTICGFLAAIGVGALPLSVKTVSAAGGRANFERFALSLAQRFDATHIMGGTNVEGLIPLPVAVRSSMVPGRGKDPLSAFPVHRSEDVAFVQFSSGTNATPKGVPITQGKLIEQLEMIIAQDEGSEDGAGASWLPLYHDMGLIGALLTSHYRGRTLHLSTPTGFMLDPVEWLLSLSEHAITTAVLPNFAIRYLLKRLDDTER